MRLVLFAVALLALVLLSPASGEGRTGGRAVALSDAKTAPRGVALVRPGQAVSVPARCVTEDVSAYRWDGRAAGPQEWHPRGLVMSWRVGSGRVVFDGVAFTNRATVPALVAWWGGRECN